MVCGRLAPSLGKQGEGGGGAEDKEIISATRADVIEWKRGAFKNTTDLEPSIITAIFLTLLQVETLRDSYYFLNLQKETSLSDFICKKN